VIALDTNLLIYVFVEEMPFHEAAEIQLRPVIEGSQPWAIPWPCIHEFISISTNTKIFKPAASMAESFQFLESFRSAPHLHLLAESAGYFEKLTEITKASKISGPRIHDARIAALCLHHGVTELWTADRDFSNFPKLKTRNPLIDR
jgi:hypothetical protein